MLCYFKQIWTSDNTDAYCRLAIQEGTSYGYPLSSIGAHVSDCPNHQTLRVTSLDSRFNVACFGVLGYELISPRWARKKNNKSRTRSHSSSNSAPYSSTARSAGSGTTMSFNGCPSAKTEGRCSSYGSRHSIRQMQATMSCLCRRRTNKPSTMYFPVSNESRFPCSAASSNRQAFSNREAKNPKTGRGNHLASRRNRTLHGERKRPEIRGNQIEPAIQRNRFRRRDSCIGGFRLPLVHHQETLNGLPMPAFTKGSLSAASNRIAPTSNPFFVK